MRVWLVLLLLFVPFAQAGTSDAPEITDPSGDGPDADPESARDLVAGWIEYLDDEEIIRFHARLAADPTHIFASLNAGSEVIRFGFTPDSKEMEGLESYVRMRFGWSTGTGNAGDEIATCRYGEAAEDEYEDIKTQTDLAAGFDGAHFWCDLPFEQIGHSGGSLRLTQTHMDAHLLQRGPLSGTDPYSGDLAGVNEVVHYDRAPDSGYGADFAVVPAVATNVTGNTTGEAAGSNATASAGNATGNATSDATDDAPAADDAGDEADGCEGNATCPADEAVDSADDQESPGLPALLGLVAVAAVAWTRRRS